jgi:signal peptidase I
MSNNQPERVLVSWLKQIVLVIFLTVMISVFLVQTYDIKDVSMEPTFDRQGNRALVFLTPYIFKTLPGRGDIVIIDSRVERTRTLVDRLVESPLPALFIQPGKEQLWVKRVIGLPGDRLEFAMGRVYLNGELLSEDYIKEKMISDLDPVLVPEGHIYVLGDNRNRSSDSRQIGPIPLENIQGKVIARIFPFSKLKSY